MEQIRARIDAIVKDPKTAAALKPYYPYGCKRPTFHDEFLPTFNLPHVTLVDTAPLGVSKINARGVVHDGVEYPLDVLIYATGFQWMATSTFNMITGRGGQTLQQKWKSEGVKTFLGLHSQGFPNLFIMSGPQGGGGQFNFTRGIEGHTDYVIWMLKTLRERGAGIVDIKKEPEIAYAEHCREADITTRPLRDCLSYYNGDGAAEPGSLAYYGGPQKWHAASRARRRNRWSRMFLNWPRPRVLAGPIVPASRSTPITLHGSGLGPTCAALAQAGCNGYFGPASCRRDRNGFDRRCRCFGDGRRHFQNH